MVCGSQCSKMRRQGKSCVYSVILCKAKRFQESFGQSESWGWLLALCGEFGGDHQWSTLAIHVCWEAQLCTSPWLAPGMEHECNSPPCLQHTILCSSHPENGLGWSAEVGDVKKVSVLSASVTAWFQKHEWFCFHVKMGKFTLLNAVF